MAPLLVDAPLLYGVPLVLCAGMQCGFELLLSRCARAMNPWSHDEEEARPTKNDATDVDRIRVTVATGTDELARARELVRSRYSWRGYDVDALSGVKGNQTSARPHEVTFVAHADESLLGTLTLRLDGPQGLMAESTHGSVIEDVREQGGRVCELTRLAVVENPHSKLVLASLFGITHALALTVHQISDAFIEVNPRHVRFYSKLLGFVATAGERFCERVQAPSVLLRLELKEQLQMFGIEPSYLEPVFAKAA